MKKFISVLAAAMLAVALVGCNTSSSSSVPDVSSQMDSSSVSQSQETQSDAKLPDTDPSGAAIQVPEKIETIGVLAPSFAETLVALGEGDKIVVYDTQSAVVEGLPKDAVQLDMVNPDMEQLMLVKPDVLLVTNMTLYDGSNPFQQLIDAGVCVICVPTSDSIADIQDDLKFIAQVFGKQEQGEKMVAEMQKEIDRIAEIGKTVENKKKVYFEIAAAPDAYSFGKGVFLNEMIELVGAENVLADQDGWLPVDTEAVVAENPDVILTNVNYLDDAVQEILTRSGWENTTAVKDKQVYYIDNFASSLPNQNIVKALDEIAKAVYPDLYK